MADMLFSEQTLQNKKKHSMAWDENPKAWDDAAAAGEAAHVAHAAEAPAGPPPTINIEEAVEEELRVLA
jgi:hypothetical protein